MTNIKHVATLAGVSASTVSRVLNGKSYVNETTRQKVMEAVQKTNYRPNVPVSYTHLTLPTTPYV